MHYLGSALGALVFIMLMSLVREPHRRTYNAILVAGASGVYMSAGAFGVLEIVYAAIAGGILAHLGLRSYRFIGIAWMMHTAWDLAHHEYGAPIWPFMPTSSLGCAIFDAIIAAWFLIGAPSWVRLIDRPVQRGVS